MTGGLFLNFLHPFGLKVIALLAQFASLSGLTAAVSLLSATVCIWVMQVATRDAGLWRRHHRIALAQRVALALLAFFLSLNGVTPFITLDPPWLASLPLSTAILFFLIAYGLSIVRAQDDATTKSE